MSRELWLWWSGGKDAAWALHRLLDDDRRHVVGLVTTLDPRTGRVPYQGCSRDVLEAQAAAVGLPLHVEEIEFPVADAVYVEHVRRVVHAAGVEEMAFGDVHLEDVRAWREARFAEQGMPLHFPLWGAEPRALAEEMLAGGLAATVTCVDPARIPPSWLGKPWDADFLRGRPGDVDPGGEFGEFHTVVHGSPDFVAPLDLASGEVRERGPFRELEMELALVVDGTLDLHPFPPRQIRALVGDYLDACRERGVWNVRLIHGKGIGVQREAVHAVLRRRDDVLEFGLGDATGGWGATWVRLRPGEDPGEGAAEE